MELRIKPLNVDLIAPSPKNFLNPDQGGSKIVIIGKPGCFEEGTRVQTYWYGVENGKQITIRKTKKIEDVTIEDTLVGDEGQPQPVLDVCRGVDRFYVIRNSTTGQPIVRVNEQHILTLYYETYGIVVDIPLIAYQHRFNTRELREGFKWIQKKWCSKGESWETKMVPFEVDMDEWEEQYYGVVLGGNHRFLLGDGSVVHNTGKTTLITSLMYEKSNIFPTALVMSGTEDSNGHYKRIIPSTFVYNKLEEKKIEDFVTRQKIAKKHLTNPWSVILLDDCTDEPKVLNKPIFQGMYKNGRHWKMLFILSLQYCMDIKPVIRTNIDGTFILRESNLRNRKTLWENYAGIIPDFSLFCQIMDVITDDYTALYIHNATQSNRIEDCVFWYKAKKVPSNFKFGSREFWRFHKQRFDENFTESYRF